VVRLVLVALVVPSPGVRLATLGDGVYLVIRGRLTGGVLSVVAPEKSAWKGLPILVENIELRTPFFRFLSSWGALSYSSM